MIHPLTEAFTLIKDKGLEIKTWDGCFNIRKMAGNSSVWSLHSWGIAIDIDAFENGFGEEPKMDLGLVDCFRPWFDWGGDWQRKDGMHFQIKHI